MCMCGDVHVYMVVCMCTWWCACVMVCMCDGVHAVM